MIKKQGCEIFFLEIGVNDQGSKKSGDAIVLTMGNRFSNDRNDYKIVVVDGAFTSDAETIKKYLEMIGAENSKGKLQIDLMISTHPDEDHIMGLTALAKDYNVKIEKLWIHGCKKTRDRIVQSKKVEASLQQAKDLIKIAREKNIPMEEPFAGLIYTPNNIDAEIEVLGPTEEYYQELIQRKENNGLIGKAIESTKEKVDQIINDKIREEIFNDETLKDPEENATSNINNSSAIILLSFIEENDKKSLAIFNGDAGVPALEKTIQKLQERGWYDNNIERKFIQIPHHGSRRNVGPTLLNKLLGSKTMNEYRGTSFVSAHAKNPYNHPRKSVMNAFTRRGFKDIKDYYSSKRCEFGNVPDVKGWGRAELIDLLLGEKDE